MYGESSRQPQKPKERRGGSADSMDSEHSEEDEESVLCGPEDTVLSDEEDVSGPLTRAKLLTFTEIGAPWVAVGDGVVSVEITVESVGGAPPPTAQSVASERGSGKVGRAEEGNAIACGLVAQRVARLEVVELENPEEVLLSTPIDVEGVYQVRDGTVLVWKDAQLGRYMAFQFRRAEGCEAVVREITAFQRSEMLKREASDETVVAEGLAVDDGNGGGGVAGGADRDPGVRDRFAVTAANLPGIQDAVNVNPLIFGSYVRDDMSYFQQLAALFEERSAKGDTASMERIAQITLGLLGPPYNSEGRILGQFMESAYVDKCVDIVQYALGRKDKASGFVSLEERRATFRNPLRLPEPILQRIHLLYSALYLRDLLPLSLDDGEGGSPCVLNLLLLRFKFTLINEICTKPEFLQRAFHESQEAAPDRPEEMYSLAAFVQDMSRIVKNSPIPLDMKEELYGTMIQAGLFPFCRGVLLWGLPEVTKAHEESRRSATAVEEGEPVMRRRSEAEKAVEATCDVLSHSLFVVSSARDDLKSECEENPSRCVLALIMRCFTLMQHSSALQAAYDVVVGAAFGAQSLLVYPTYASPGAQRAIIRFWVEGSGVETPPLFVVASHLATLLRKGADTATEKAERPRVLWSHGEELQLLYGFRVLNAVAEKVEEGFRTSFGEVLRASGVLPAAQAVMKMVRVRRAENVQSSIVSFLTRLITTGDGHIVKLLEADAAGEGAAEGLLPVCMSLLLSCPRRQSILTAALGSLFVHLCSEVHQEKLQLAEAAAALSPLQTSFVIPMDGSNPLSPDLAGSHRGRDAAESHYLKAAAALVSVFGAQLEEHAPVVAERLRSSLRETPEEAKRSEAESPSLPSTISRAGDGLSEFELLAMEFGVDVPRGTSPPRSPSRSPKSEAAVGATEDSLLSEPAETDGPSGSHDTETEEEGESSSSDDDDDDGTEYGETRSAETADGPSAAPPSGPGEDGRALTAESTEGGPARKRARPDAEGGGGGGAGGHQRADHTAATVSASEALGNGGGVAGSAAEQPAVKGRKAPKRPR